MLIITQDSEHALMSILSRNDEPSSCLVLGFSRVPDKPEDWFPKTVSQAQQALEGKNGCMILRFDDGDVAIIARGVGREYMARLASPFALDAFALFTLPSEREEMKVLCQAKIDLKRHTARQTFGTADDRHRIGEILRVAFEEKHQEEQKSTLNMLEKMEESLMGQKLTPDELLQYIWNSRYVSSDKRKK